MNNSKDPIILKNHYNNDDFIKNETKKKRSYNDAFYTNEISFDNIVVNFNYISSSETEINIEFNKQKKPSILLN
jgi:hypothetical protein